MPNLENVILRGTAASQPAANTVPTGSLYFQTDTFLTQRSNGTTWDSYSGSGSSSSQGAGSLWLPEFGDSDPFVLPIPGPVGPTGASGAASLWTLIATSTPSGVDHVDFTGLSGFSDIRVLLRLLTYGTNVTTFLRVSTDNGVTFLSSSGDYIGVSGAGGESNFTGLQFASGTPTPVTGEIYIEGINLSVPKVARSNVFSADSIYLRLMAVASPINAVRVTNSTPVNMTGGTIYVFGR